MTYLDCSDRLSMANHAGAVQLTSIDSNTFNYEEHIVACAHGDRQALKRLYQQEGARLLGVAKRMSGDLSVAEDILHDAFIAIWNHASQFDASKGSARGWMFTITRHLALNKLRDGRHEISMDDDETVMLDNQMSMSTWQNMSDHFDWKASRGQVLICLDKLEPVRRNCVLYAYVEGRSHSEIATLLNAPVGTVKAWIKRSLLVLRECMA